MPFLHQELANEAEAAIAAMKARAVAARALHARAELLRHMVTTARKFTARPADEAVEGVVREWMDAWGLDRDEWPRLAVEMEVFTLAIRGFVAAPSDASDAAVRDAFAGLEAAFGAAGTTLADEMAWRSQCAHGWWGVVSPEPAGLKGAKPRPSIPPLDPGKPFWENGCADFCRGG